MLATQPDITPPQEYRDFLRVMGKKRGHLFAGTDISYPACLDFRDGAIDFSKDDDPTLTIKGKFFFAIHQGYQFYYFKAGDPRVYVHSEGEENNPYHTYKTFAALVEEEFSGDIDDLDFYEEIERNREERIRRERGEAPSNERYP